MSPSSGKFSGFVVSMSRGVRVTCRFGFILEEKKEKEFKGSFPLHSIHPLKSPMPFFSLVYHPNRKEFEWKEYSNIKQLKANGFAPRSQQRDWENPGSFGDEVSPLSSNFLQSYSEFSQSTSSVLWLE